MAEDKGKSGGVGGFGAGGAGFGVEPKNDEGRGGDGKKDSVKPDIRQNHGQREGFKNGIKRDVFKQGLKPESGAAEGGEAVHKKRRRRRGGTHEAQRSELYPAKGGPSMKTFRDSETPYPKSSDQREDASFKRRGDIGQGGEKAVGAGGKVYEGVGKRDSVGTEKKPEEIVKKEDAHAEKKHEETPLEAPPEPPVAPINPFNSFSPDLPPMSYETRYEDKNAEEKSFDKQEPIDTEIPVNPFETSIFPDEPFGAKPLDEKPLEEKVETGNVKESEKSSKKDYEEVKGDFSVKESEPWSSGMPEVFAAEPVVAEVVEEKKVFEAETLSSSMPEVKGVSDRVGGIEFKSEFFKVLESAGITKGKIIVFASFFAVAVITLLFFVFGWYKVFIFWGDAGEDVEEASETELPGGGSEGGTNSETLPDDSSGNIFGIVSSYIFGLEYQPVVGNITAEPITTWGSTSGLDASFVFGKIQDLKKHRFSEYAEIVRNLKNISETDVYKLLDLSSDRRKALNDHLNLMKELIDKAESTSVFLESEIERIRGEYMLLNDQRAVYEEQFFAEVQAMDGDSAYNSMGKFIDSSQQVVALKAYFSANQSILKLVNDYKNILEPRYKDISVNIEALIKGVKVFEVPQSNIDAIIPLNQ